MFHLPESANQPCLVGRLHCHTLTSLRRDNHQLWYLTIPLPEPFQCEQHYDVRSRGQPFSVCYPDETKMIMWKNETCQFLTDWYHLPLNTVECTTTRSIRCYKDIIQVILNELFNRAFNRFRIPWVFVGTSITSNNSDKLC